MVDAMLPSRTDFLGANDRTTCNAMVFSVGNSLRLSPTKFEKMARKLRAQFLNSD